MLLVVCIAAEPVFVVCSNASEDYSTVAQRKQRGSICKVPELSAQGQTNTHTSRMCGTQIFNTVLGNLNGDVSAKHTRVKVS
jgi:hypothetical protein